MAKMKIFRKLSRLIVTQQTSFVTILKLLPKIVARNLREWTRLKEKKKHTHIRMANALTENWHEPFDTRRSEVAVEMNSRTSTTVGMTYV